MPIATYVSSAPSARWRALALVPLVSGLLMVSAPAAADNTISPAPTPSVPQPSIPALPSIDDTIVTQDDSTSAARERRTNQPDAVSIESPETVDEAIALLRMAEEAQALSEVTARTLDSARVELSAASRLAVLARVSLEAVSPNIAVAEQRIGTLAARQWMAGGAPSWSALLEARTPEAAITIMDFEAYMGSVTDSYLADAERVKATVSALQVYADQTAADEEVARQRVSDLEANLDASRQTVSIITRAYQEYIARPGPQTRVGSDGCPVADVSGTLRGGAEAFTAQELCKKSVAEAASPQAALAVKYAFSKLGAPYACEGIGRMGPWRFDCSSLVSRAYSEAAGIPVAGTTWAPSTRDMMPWGGVSLDPHYVEVATDEVRPGDLLLYRSCSAPSCSFQHVVMALADGFILHTNSCGDVAHITKSSGYGPGSNFVVARRVVLLDEESALVPTATFGTQSVDPSTFLTKSQFLELQERQSALEEDENEGSQDAVSAPSTSP